MTEPWLWTRVYLDAVISKWNRTSTDDVTCIVTLNMCLFQTNALSKDPECDSGANSSVNNAVIVVTPSVHMLMSIIHCLYLINRRCFKCRYYKYEKIITNWRQLGVLKAEGGSYLNKYPGNHWRYILISIYRDKQYRVHFYLISKYLNRYLLYLHRQAWAYMSNAIIMVYRF
jgi:hypothetical protein